MEKKFLSAQDFATAIVMTIGEPIMVESLGGFVNIKRWSGKERLVLISEAAEVYGTADFSEVDKTRAMDSTKVAGIYNLMMKLVLVSLCDAAGQQIFTVTEENQEILQSALPEKELLHLFEQASQRNGLFESSLAVEVKN